MSNASATVSFTWTLVGRLASESTDYAAAGVPDQVVGYGFNGAGQPTTVSGQGSIASFGYGPQGRLTSVTDTIAGAFSYGYDPSTGLPATFTRPNGVIDTFSFDANARLTSRDATDSLGTILSQADYAYNTAGLRSSLTDLAGVHDYTYDSDGRLIGVDNPAGGLVDEAFSYDSVGNRTSWNNNPASQVHYDAGDRLTQDATFTYAYDNEGNQTSQRERTSGAVTTYTWNAAHQLTRITNPDGTTIDYGYDPLGRRISTTNSAGDTTFQVWAGANPRATLDATGQVTARIVTNPTRLADTLAVTTSSGDTIYPLVDGLGSTTATTDPAGTVTSRTAYTAYGTPTVTSGTNPISGLAGYTGYQADPTGLDYARARYYNPNTGRFLSQDPVTAVNPYPYGLSSPTNFVDRTGKVAFTFEAIRDAEAYKSIVGGMAFGTLIAIPRCLNEETALGYARCELVAAGIGGAAGGAGYALAISDAGILGVQYSPVFYSRTSACLAGSAKAILEGESGDVLTSRRMSSPASLFIGTVFGCAAGALSVP